MTYRIVCKKFSEMKNGLVIVEQEIEANTFQILDGNLVFCDEHLDQLGNSHLIPFMAFPPTLWIIVEPANMPAPPPEGQTLVIP